MKEDTLNVIEFIVPVYGSKVIVLVYDKNWREIIKFLKLKGFNTKEYRGWGESINGLQLSERINGTYNFVVIVKKNKSIKETLIHELFHLTQDILEYKGVDFIKGHANESYAYLIGALYIKIEKLLK
jgi:hypothetical protein